MSKWQVLLAAKRPWLLVGAATNRKRVGGALEYFIDIAAFDFLGRRWGLSIGNSVVPIRFTENLPCLIGRFGRYVQ